MAGTAEILSTSEERSNAQNALKLAGKDLLPKYLAKAEELLAFLGDLFKRPGNTVKHLLDSTLTNATEGKAECEKLYQDKTQIVDKRLAVEMLKIAAYAWAGHETSDSSEYQKLTLEEIPPIIRALYNTQTGLLSDFSGLKAWLGKKGNAIVISHAGTDVQVISTVAADIIQLSKPSVLYLEAAGLLKLMLAEHPTSDFYVTGHSLGGGLAQFSVAANLNIRDNIQAYGYNPSGLSMLSLKNLGTSRLEMAKKKTWIFVTTLDPISMFGGQLGCVTTLPKSKNNGHQIGDIKECMTKYIALP